MITSQVNQGKKKNIVQNCSILLFLFLVSLIHVLSNYRIFCICREPKKIAIYELMFALVEEMLITLCSLCASYFAINVE
jgi:hypothetical protein